MHTTGGVGDGGGGGRPRVVFALTITRGKIVAIDLVADPERLGQLDVTILAPLPS